MRRSFSLRQTGLESTGATLSGPVCMHAPPFSHKHTCTHAAALERRSSWRLPAHSCWIGLMRSTRLVRAPTHT